MSDTKNPCCQIPLAQENPAKLITQGLLVARTRAQYNLPKGRETALVITKIDEALLWLTQVPIK